MVSSHYAKLVCREFICPQILQAKARVSCKLLPQKLELGLNYDIKAIRRTCILQML